MRTVWIINHYATDPRESASGSRHYSLSRGLIKHGWYPVIIAASTEHPSGSQRSLGDTDRDGVQLHYLRVPSYRTGLGRLINMMAFSTALLFPGATEGLRRPDAVIGSTVHPLAAWAASVLARRAQVPFIFEIRDLWPQTLIDMGKLKPTGLPARLMRKLELKLCARAEKVITLLPYAHEYLESYGVPAEKITWISNGTDTHKFSEIVKKNSESFVFMYLGSIGRANGVGALLDAFMKAAAHDSHLELVIIGNGTEREHLKERASKSEHRHRIIFEPAVPKDRVPNVVASADALLINVLDLDVYRYGVSMNKLFDYAAASRPIIAASNARNNFVEDGDCGIAVPADHVLALAKAMRRMASPELNVQRRQWGINARKYVSEHYDYQKLSTSLSNLLVEATNNTKEQDLSE
jgi:glycosyltransferase involved in cell wall biosynthesis